MEEKNEITVLLPVHELNDATRPLFANAVTSLGLQDVKPDAVLVIVPKGSDVAKELKTYDFGKAERVSVIENDGGSDFQSQVNFGVDNAKTEWVSILELDDEYSKVWFRKVVEYRGHYPEVDIFLPIVIDADKDQKFIGLTNEAVWAQSFCEEMGILNNDSLLTYQNFTLTGAAFKKSLCEDFGGLKPSIKLTFTYEFLLRMTEKDSRVMTIPKFGYKHMNQREGSLFHSYRTEIDPVEAKWWLSQAKKESYFPNDRDIKYDIELG